MMRYPHRVTYAHDEEAEPCGEPDCTAPAEYTCVDCGEFACGDHLSRLQDGECNPEGRGRRGR